MNNRHASTMRQTDYSNDSKHINPLDNQPSKAPSQRCYRLPPIKEHQASEDNINADAHNNIPLLTSSSPITLSSTSTETDPSTAAFLQFASTIPFTLTFATISYPQWATQPTTFLPYLPVPLTPLPGIPVIPSPKLDIPFTSIMDNVLFGDTIDGILESNGYELSRHDVWKVYVGFTFKDGRRLRLAISVDNVELLVGPWARDVWLGFVDVVARYCACGECMAEREQGLGGKKLGHGLVVEVVFPQGAEGKRKDQQKDNLKLKGEVGCFGGKERRPFQARRAKDSEGGSCAGVVKRVRFN